MSFQEYPKAMSHPQYQPAVISQDTVDRATGRTIKAPSGVPAKFPPVYVNNKDQEAQYASLGYVPNGVSDPDEYLSAIIGADQPHGHEHVDFPKYLYTQDDDGDLQVLNEGGDIVGVRSLLIGSQAAQDKLVGSWYATPGDAANAGPDDEPAGEAEEAQEGTAEEGSAEAAPTGRGRRR